MLSFGFAMTNSPPIRALAERHTSLAGAIALAEAEMEDLGVRARLQELGQPPFTTIQVDLVDSTDEIVAWGVGKGEGEQCRASAFFESLEHLWVERGPKAAFDRPESIQVARIEDLLEQPPLRREHVLTRFAREFPGARVRVAKFVEWGSGAALWYPLFLKNPYFALMPNDPPDDHARFEAYGRYSSNSGTASGATEEDALLHALLEAIERDAMSLALLEWFASASPSSLRTVAVEALPDDLQLLHRKAEELLGSPPVLLDITSDLDVPAFMALPSRQGPYLGMHGSGASLNPQYAVQRALQELVQMHHCCEASPELDIDLRRQLPSLAAWPTLTQCVELDPAVILTRPQRPSPLTAAVTTAPPAGALGAQLQTLVQRLNAQGLQFFHFRWSPPSSRVPVVCALVPGLEMFSLSTSGAAILPTGRGYSRLRLPAVDDGRLDAEIR